MDEDTNFGDVAPSLFGLGFAQKSKELVEQVKALRSDIVAPEQFFDQAPQQLGGLHSEVSKRKSPDCPVRQPSSSGEDVPKESVEQVTYAHTFLNTMIIN